VAERIDPSNGTGQSHLPKRSDFVSGSEGEARHLAAVDSPRICLPRYVLCLRSKLPCRTTTARARSAIPGGRQRGRGRELTLLPVTKAVKETTYLLYICRVDGYVFNLARMARETHLCGAARSSPQLDRPHGRGLSPAEKRGRLTTAAPTSSGVTQRRVREKGGGLREACPAGAGDSIGRRSDGPATKIIIISTELFFLSSVQRCSCSLGGGFFFFFCCLHARSSGCNADVRVASSAASIGSENLRM